MNKRVSTAYWVYLVLAVIRLFSKLFSKNMLLPITFFRLVNETKYLEYSPWQKKNTY